MPTWERSNDESPEITSVLPEQAAALKAGKQLTARDLTPPQIQMLEQILIMRAFGIPRAFCETLSLQLENMQTSVLQPDPNSPAPQGMFVIAHVVKPRSGTPLVTRIGFAPKEVRP